VCYGKSGFCDCNGNNVWEGNETGVTCGMNQKPNKILCNLECKIYNCTYQFFNTSNCTAAGYVETMYGKARYKDFDTPFYKSVLINHPGCKVTVFGLEYLQGPHHTYGSPPNATGAVCKNFRPFLDQALSAESTDICHAGHPLANS